ncbi:MAG: acyltransferase [Oligoflexia bacterium]|nr:acyltransferase [Oligoflexia bacterium]
MRKITALQILVFACLLTLAIGLTAAVLLLAVDPVFRSEALRDFRGIADLSATLVLLFGFALLTYRLFLKAFPLREGPIAPGSGMELRYHVHLLFHLMFFQPLTRSFVVPVPLMRLIYVLLGCRLGANSYSAGTILDPILTEVGDNVIIGHGAALFSHAVEGDDLSLSKIWIGNRVTIGAGSVIMPGVTIGDGAIIAVSSVIPKGTRVGAGEIWAGVPARMISVRKAKMPDKTKQTQATDLLI